MAVFLSLILSNCSSVRAREEKKKKTKRLKRILLYDLVGHLVWVVSGWFSNALQEQKHPKKQNVRIINQLNIMKTQKMIKTKVLYFGE